jgi:hypothetical protein
VRTRLRGVLAFLAIVWGVAASFVAVDVLFVSGASRLAQSGALGTLALSPAVQRSQVCAVPPGDSAAAGPRASPDVLAAAWDLGVRMGLHARVAQMIADGNKAAGDAQPPEWFAARRRIVEGSAAVLARMSAALKVPTPAPFTPAREATVNIEFVPFVEGETNQTGRALAAMYGATACELYQTGAYWGHSVMVRTALPGEPSIYSREIEYHARRAGLRESLWAPLIAPTAANADGSSLAAEADAATVRIANELRGTGEPASAPLPK